MTHCIVSQCNRVYILRISNSRMAFRKNKLKLNLIKTQNESMYRKYLVMK